jgi:hypothetical protein
MTRAAVVVVALALAGCADSRPVLSSALVGVEPLLAKPEYSSQWTPLSFTVFNSCSGESIAVAGSAHLTTRIWNEGDRIRIRGHTNINLAGVGLTSGRGYRLVQLTNTDVEMDVTSGATTTEQVHHLSMISGGSLPNARVTMNGTLVLDPAGNSSIIPKRWEVTCR